MSDWVREVEHAGYSSSVQYTGPSSERSPLLAREAGAKFVKLFWVLFLLILFCAGLGIGCYLILEEDREYPVSKPYIVISRSGWRSSPPIFPLPPYSNPVTHVSITQTSTSGCDSSADCARLVRNIQQLHLQSNLSDIAYNFLVAGDGATYEGRGWNNMPGLGAEEERDRMVMVAFIGTFDQSVPSTIQIEEFKIFLQKAVQRGHIDPCFTISLYKEHPQDGGGQLVHVFNRLVMENNRRKVQIKCS